MKIDGPLTIGAERRRHPVYRYRAIYWATVYQAGYAVAQMGPYRDKQEALSAAASMKQHREERPAMYKPGPRVDLPGQMELPQTGPDRAGLARRLVAAAMKPKAPQKPMDIGLFGDVKDQLDLVEMARKSST